MTNIRAHKYRKQILTCLKGEIDNNTVIVCDFNPHLSVKDRSSRHKVKKETLDLNYALHQTDLIGTCGTFHPTAAEYTLFSSEQGTLTDTSCVRSQVFENFRRLKSYQVSFLTTVV